MSLLKMFDGDTAHLTPPADVDNGKYLFLGPKQFTYSDTTISLNTVVFNDIATNNVWCASQSPDNQLVVFGLAVSPYVRIYKKSTSGFQLLINGLQLDSNMFRVSKAIWSPDSSYLTLVLYDTSGQDSFRMFKRNKTTNTFTRVMLPASANTIPAVTDYTAGKLDWTNDGTTFVVGSDVRNGTYKSICVYTLSGETFVDKTVTSANNGGACVISPDGNYLVRSRYDDSIDIWTKSGATWVFSRTVQLDTTSATIKHMEFHPTNSNYVYISADCVFNTTRSNRIFAVNVTNGTKTQMLNLGGVSTNYSGINMIVFGISPDGQYMFVNGTTVTSGSGSTVTKTLYKFASLTSISAKVNNSELLYYLFAPGFC